MTQADESTSAAARRGLERARRRRGVLAAASATCVLCLVLVVVFADRARRADEASLPGRLAAVELLGFADLALNSGARWLRHPSQVEPAAAMADLPAALDSEPAGGAIAPPVQVLGAGARDVEVVRGPLP